MRINIELDTQDADDLRALTALVTALGGATTMPTGAIRMRRFDPLAAGTMGDPRPVEDGVMVIDDAGPDERDLPGGDGVTQPANADDRDATGLPWDERIHASSRTRNADGSWRQRRGVDAETVKRITESLKLGEAARSAPQPDNPPAPPAPSDGPAAPVPMAPEPPAAPAVSAPPPPPVVAHVGEYPQYKRFQALTKVTGAAGKVYADLNPMAQAIGLNAYADVAKNEDRIVDFITMAVTLDLLPADTMAQYEARLAESMAA